jgi:hypothetical protein
LKTAEETGHEKEGLDFYSKKEQECFAPFHAKCHKLAGFWN